MFRQIAGFVARRIVAHVKEGDSTKQGQEFGFIKFGSRVDIFFPLDTKVRVKLGDKVYGGLNIIADMPKKQ
jgi:phosphatidylserine decarboxylase